MIMANQLRWDSRVVSWRENGARSWLACIQSIQSLRWTMLSCRGALSRLLKQCNFLTRRVRKRKPRWSSRWASCSIWCARKTRSFPRWLRAWTSAANRLLWWQKLTVESQKLLAAHLASLSQEWAITTPISLTDSSLIWKNRPDKVLSLIDKHS